MAHAPLECFSTMRYVARPDVANNESLRVACRTRENRLTHIERSDQLGQLNLPAPKTNLVGLRVLKQPTYGADVFRNAQPMHDERIDLARGSLGDRSLRTLCGKPQR